MANGNRIRHINTPPPPYDVSLIYNLPIRAFITAASIVALAAVMFVSIACSGSSGGSSPTGSDSPVGLLLEDTEDFVVFDVKSIMDEETPEKIRNDFERDWPDILEGVGIFVEDLEAIVHVGGGGRIMVKGNLSLTDIRGELHDQGFEEDTYTGYELWYSESGYRIIENQLSNEVRYVAILDDSTVLMGDEDWVKDVIRAINRESGLVMHADDSGVTQVLDKAGSGWFTSVFDCGRSELRGCEFGGSTFGRGAESFEIKMVVTLLFRSERTAESEASDVESAMFDSGEDVYVESLTTDGALVILEVIFYEDDLEDEYGTLW